MAALMVCSSTQAAEPSAQDLEIQSAKLSQRRHYQEAILLEQRALAIREKELGPEHPATATTLNNLAEAYQDTGSYAKAEPLYQRVLAIDEKAHGPENPDIATDLNNLSCTRPQVATRRPSRASSERSRSTRRR